MTNPKFGLRGSHISTSLLSVIGGEVLLRVANFLAAAVIGRLFGLTVFGQYATVLAAVTVAERIADNGLEVTGIAEVSSGLQDTDKVLGSLYLVKTTFSALVAAALVMLGLSFRVSPTMRVVAGFLGVRVLLYSYCRLHTGIMKALDHMRTIGIIELVHALLLYCGIFLSYFHHYSLYVLLAILLSGQILEFSASLIYLLMIGVRPRLSALANYLSIAKRATPIGITYTSASLGLRADVIILSMLVSPVVLGIFAAANTGIVMVYVVAWLFGGVILSKMSPIAGDLERLNRYTWKWGRLVITTMLPMALVAAVVAPRMITVVFGERFSPAGTLASIMSLAAPFIVLNAVFLSRSIAKKTSFEHVTIFVGTGIVSVILDFVFGKLYGAIGVSWVIVIRELSICIAFLCYGRKARTSGAAISSEAFETRVSG